MGPPPPSPSPSHQHALVNLEVCLDCQLVTSAVKGRCGFREVSGTCAASEHDPILLFHVHSRETLLLFHTCETGSGVASEMRHFQVSKGAAITLVALLAGACMAVSRWRCCLALALAA